MDGERQVRLLTAALELVPVGPVLERVVGGAALLLGLSGMTAALMSEGNGGEVVGSPTSIGARLLDLEFALGEGPARDADATGAEVLVSDLGTDGGMRWPAYTTGALDLGAGSVHVFPARLGGIRIGVLLGHDPSPRALTASELTDARVFAEVCTALMVDHAAGLDSEGLLSTGWPNRAVVHQATGMVAAQLGIPLPAALARLRAYAYSAARSLEAVARDVVARELQLEADEPDRPPNGEGRTTE